MDLSHVIGTIKPSLPIILVADGGNNIVSKGSGFIFQKPDLVVTCAHVINNVGNGNVLLQFPEEENFITAKVVITDLEHDIALLKFEPNKDRTPLSLAQDEAKEGTPVLFSGYPFSLMSLTTHQGIISCVITDPTGMKRYLIDGTINPGNSGGPLMNTRGEILGVVDATRRESNDILSKVQSMSTGALALHGLDIVELYNALVNNLQLGVGYAVPSSYIPHYPDPDGDAATKKQARGKK